MMLSLDESVYCTYDAEFECNAELHYVTTQTMDRLAVPRL